MILHTRRIELRIERRCGSAHLIVVHSIDETRSRVGIANQVEPRRCECTRHVAETAAVRGDDAALHRPHSVVVRRASDDATDFVVTDRAIANIQCDPGDTDASASRVTTDRAVGDVELARGSRRKLGLDSTANVAGDAAVADIGRECGVALRRDSVALVGVEGAAADIERAVVMEDSTTLRIQDRAGVFLESRIRDPHDGTNEPY